MNIHPKADPAVIELLALIKVPSPTAERLAEKFTVHQLPKEQPARDEMLAAVGPRIRGIVTGTGGFVDEALLERLPALEIIACYTAGMDPIDLDAVARRKIELFNNSAALSDTVADLAMGLVLEVARDIGGAHRYVSEGNWLKARYRPGNLLRGRRMGIVGLGGIGRAIAQRATAFGIEVAYFGPRQKADVPYRYFGSLLEMSEWCNILMLSCPGGPETHHIVDEPVLNALGPEGWLINVARGSVVDQEAMVRALVEGRVGRAGLDVFENEPQVPEALFGLDRVVLSPHQGSSSIEVLPLRAEITVGNLARHFGI